MQATVHSHLITTLTQQHVYDTCVSTLFDKFVEGFNATIVAYGQTGSGKSYSMGTASDGADPGIIPRFIHHLFAAVPDAQISATFLELHNEDLIDLLNPSSKNISIREDSRGNIYWLGAQEQSTANPDQLLSVLQKGSIARSTGATDMNKSSSRSHAIFTVIMKRYISEDDSSGDSATDNGGKVAHHLKQVESKFHFVDLAGSERLKRTNAVGERVKEGIAINSGLLALGNVISALGDDSRKTSHVPYRDSKLTRLLQDSLGGNSQTLMLACISPSEVDFIETLSTLKYANRARNIKNNAVQNFEQSENHDIERYRKVIGRLKAEITEQESFMTAAINEIDTLKESLNVAMREKELLSSMMSAQSNQQDATKIIHDCTLNIEQLEQENRQLRSKPQLTVATQKKPESAIVADGPLSPRRLRKRKNPKQHPNRNSQLRNSITRLNTHDEMQSLSAVDFDGLLRHRIALETGVAPAPDLVPKAINDSLKVLDALKKFQKTSEARSSARSELPTILSKAQRQMEADVKALLQMLSKGDSHEKAGRFESAVGPKTISRSSDNKQRALAKENQSLKKKMADMTRQQSEAKGKADEVQQKLQGQITDLKHEKRKLMRRIKQEADRSKERQANLEQQIKTLQKIEDGKKKAETAVARERAAKARSQDDAHKCAGDLHTISTFLARATASNSDVDRKLVVKALGIANVRAFVNSAPKTSIPKHASPTKKVGAKTMTLQQRVAKKRRILDCALSYCMQNKYILPSIQQCQQKKTGLETELDSLMSERAVVLADELEQAKVSGIPFNELEPMYMDERIEEVMSEIHDLQSRIGVLQNAMESVASQLDANASQVAGKLDYNVAREVSTSLVKSLDIEEAALLFETLIDELVELKSFKATQAPHSAYLEAGNCELTGGICTMYQTISRSVQLARTVGIENTGVMSDLVQLYQQVSQAYSKARNVDLGYREATATATKPSSPPSSIPRSCSMLTIPISNSGLPTPSHSIPHANNPNTPAPSSIKSAR
ncbi:Kinesin-like protein kif21a [Umbelopsis nana]